VYPSTAPLLLVLVGVATATVAACSPESPPVVAPSTPVGDAGPPPPVAAASVAPATPATPTTPDGVVANNRAPFDVCYAKARTLEPRLGHTKVEMTFTIDTDGTPKNVDFKYRHRFDDAAKDCMRDAALGLHFPPTMAGTQTATISFAPPGS
jgi:outer membrane biosynthesis protein TonB